MRATATQMPGAEPHFLAAASPAAMSIVLPSPICGTHMFFHKQPKSARSRYLALGCKQRENFVSHRSEPGVGLVLGVNKMLNLTHGELPHPACKITQSTPRPRRHNFPTYRNKPFRGAISFRNARPIWAAANGNRPPLYLKNTHTPASHTGNREKRRNGTRAGV